MNQKTFDTYKQEWKQDIFQAIKDYELEMETRSYKECVLCKNSQSRAPFADSKCAKCLHSVGKDYILCLKNPTYATLTEMDIDDVYHKVFVERRITELRKLSKALDHKYVGAYVDAYHRITGLPELEEDDD